MGRHLSPSPRRITTRRAAHFVDPARRAPLLHALRGALGRRGGGGATTGMRRGEVLGMRWVDVDLERARLSVVQNLTVADHQVVGEPKTAKGRRPVAGTSQPVATGSQASAGV